MKKRNITFVINYFYPDLASTGQLMTDLCRNIQKDFNITVIAAQPNYAGESVDSSGKYEVSYLGEIKVIRIKLPKVNKLSKWSRIKYIISYFLLANIAVIREKNIDLIFTISQPPILGGLIGSLGKFFKKAKHVYNIQDFNPEQAAAINFTKKNFIYYFSLFLDKLNCKLADHIVVVGNDMEETLKKRFEYSEVPPHSVINNWASEDEIIPLNKMQTSVKEFLDTNGLQNKFVVMYSGNIGLFYDLENIIKITKNFEQNSDIVFLFIGEGAIKGDLQNYIHQTGQKNVKFLPYQPKEFIKYSLNAADVHLVVNQKGIKGISVPSKIYGVLAAGKPILGVLEKDSEAYNIIKKSKSGLLVEPNNYQGIIEAINTLYALDKVQLEELGLNGRRYLEGNFKRNISIEKYKKLLYEV
ncbi:glycosyltransferase family 4 protein [Fictibacillus enclensis]|uniref:glycosyltransferase family 4 protein n=1 Tax=Fictibacillus enclensis TaxID=1017270 RepID=UPI0025A22752|nr:glycosyltransferase family 4 protein [Fictibacillus enclensis]MDM5340536.1 glycosyltransferase family 4 protein [Fictibacillus enclensis]